MANEFLKTAIAIRFNLLQVCRPLSSFEFAVLFIPSFLGLELLI